MNVSTVKLVCWLSSAGLTFALTGYAYNFFKNFEGRKQPVQVDYVVAQLQAGQEVEDQAMQGVDYDDVKRTFHSLNWTGKKEVVKAAVVPTGPTAPVYKPVSELLMLLMIQVDTYDRAASLIYVKYTGNGLPEEAAHLMEGDSLPSPHQEISVEEIRADGVVFAFSNGRENETLEPGGPAGESLIVTVGPDGVRVPVRTGIPQAGQRARFTPEKSALIAPNRWRIGSEDARYFEANYSQILANEVRTKTYHDPKTGRRAGIQVSDVRPGSIAARHGVQDGDIIISVNGTPVTSKQEAIKFVKNNSDVYTSWEVVIENLGRRRTVTYESPSD